jgi:Kef-type K+ transport system membrane component KefB
MKDKKVTSEEFSYLALASKIVWVGLVILAASGLVLFLLDPDRLLESSKFLAKISIVFLLFINGVIFHARHLPKLKKHVGKKINKSKPFAQSSKTLFMSGGASTISWATVLVLGAISGTTLGYFTILALYSLALGIALIISQIIYYRYV